MKYNKLPFEHFEVAYLMKTHTHTHTNTHKSIVRHEMK